MWLPFGCIVAAMKRSRSLPSDPEFLLQYMEDIDSDCSDDEFNGYVDDDVIKALPGEMNDGGAAMEMMDMIMNGCNIAAEEEVVMEGEGEEGGVFVDEGDEGVGAEGGTVLVCEGDEGVGAEGGAFVGEEDEVHAVESDNSVSNGAGDPPSNRGGGSIPDFNQHSGAVKNLGRMEPLDCFFELFPEDLIEYIVMESNRYGNQYIVSHAAHLRNHPKARAHQFTRNMFTHHDLQKVLVLIICMGIVNMPSVEHYWSTRWPFCSNNFRSIMSRDRFLLVMKFLHLADNSRMIPRGQPGHSKIFKVEHVVNSLVQNYKSSYIMKKEISVDESMIAYKGRLSFLQYMPKKPHKWGIKAWVLSEAHTGYTWNFQLYTGKDETRKDDTSQYPCGNRAHKGTRREGLPCLHGQLLCQSYVMQVPLFKGLWQLWNCSIGQKGYSTLV